MRWAWLFLAACSYSPIPAEVADAAAIVDTFDATRDCPGDYTLTLANQPSRYRVIRATAKAWEHSDDCRDDRPGSTHLAAIDSAAELTGIEDALNAIGDLGNNKAWVGGVQLRSQPDPDDGWLSVTGGPMIATVWDGGEPNDTGGNEDNGENFVGIERNRTGLVDFPTTDDLGGLCECDGKPLDAAAATAIDANRQ